MEMEIVNGENTMGIEIALGGYLGMRSEVSWQDKRPVIPKTSHISCKRAFIVGIAPRCLIEFSGSRF